MAFQPFVAGGSDTTYTVLWRTKVVPCPFWAPCWPWILLWVGVQGEEHCSLCCLWFMPPWVRVPASSTHPHITHVRCPGKLNCGVWPLWFVYIIFTLFLNLMGDEFAEKQMLLVLLLFATFGGYRQWAEAIKGERWVVTACLKPRQAVLTAACNMAIHKMWHSC